MKEVKFKVGDLVYCPSKTNRIHELVAWDNLYYTLAIRDSSFLMSLAPNGVASAYSDMPSVFHATQENYELLSKLYPNVAFEPPPRKEPKEIIEAMLESGYHGVLCEISMVDEDDDSIIHCYRYDYALEVLDDKIIFSHHTMYNDELKFVSPFHQKSGMEIVDFVDGKIVLQNGEVVFED